MATILKQDRYKKNRRLGKFTLDVKDAVMMQSKTGEDSSITYEDLLAKLTTDIAVVGGGASFREIYKYDILLSL